MEKLNYKGDVATVVITSYIKPRRLDIGQNQEKVMEVFKVDLDPVQ